MKIAILGLGTVGYGVYDIIKTTDALKDIEIEFILDKNLELQKLIPEKVTNSYLDILSCEEVDTVIECMGARDFSYKCIKEALEHKKNVVTANKEVIADHLKELTKLKNEMKVDLYYEASVGGGIPIIKNLHMISETNELDSIKGIINGTTNFILSKMTEEKMSFLDSLKLAQKLGFAESDPTADLEGLDMVRKICILSSIAYKTEIPQEKIWHYGISTVSENDIIFSEKHGYVIKFIASSKKVNDNIELRVEPTLVSKSNIISYVNNENNIIEINASINDKLSFFGKGAGRYPTANAMVNDLIMIKNKDKNYNFMEMDKKTYKDSKEKNKYYIRVKNTNLINKDIIEMIENNQIITKEINFNVIKDLLSDIYFYARIGDWYEEI